MCEFDPRRRDELLWVKYQPYLLSKGYQLRPRYQPGWIASWKAGDIRIYYEDSHSTFYMNLLDARRIEDDFKVTLKRVSTKTEEIPIARFLSSETFLSDPRNRTVPILDVLPIPDDDEYAFLVMPFLRQFDDPPFHFRVECVEFFRQALQGLQFMHEHSVSHRDACYNNIMMDSRRLIPKGFHFSSQTLHDPPFFGDKFKHTTRLAVAPVHYFFVDFGLSTRFENYGTRYLVTGKGGQNRNVPELSHEIPYDPFKVDIYQLGDVFDELIETYHGLDLFQPLATAMMRRDPTQRPDASSALAQLERIVCTLGSLALEAPVIRHPESTSDWSQRIQRRLYLPSEPKEESGPRIVLRDTKEHQIE